ncbi:hypothetical protein MRX96_039700, partial [Rhipicephalus microplus]
MQSLAHAKLARFNALFLQKLKAEDRNAARKFWNYVRTLDRSEQSVHFIVDSNGNPTQDMKEALTGHLEALYGSRLRFRLKYSTSGIDENRRLPGLTFADDVVLIVETKVDPQALLDTCAAEMTELGLRFNAKKTKVVPFAGNRAEAADLKLG